MLLNLALNVVFIYLQGKKDVKYASAM